MSTSAPTALSPMPGDLSAPCRWTKPSAETRAPGGSGLPGDRAHRHRDLLLGPGPEKRLVPDRPGGGECAGRYLTCRIRLGSLEPRTITEEFCRRAAVLPNLCPHFHLSLQSGCDATLKRMNRKYDTARYYEICKITPGSLSAPRLSPPTSL